MSAEREAEEAEATESGVAMTLAKVPCIRHLDARDYNQLAGAVLGYAKSIAARVDAEWRARVEGARKQIESKAFIVVNDDPNHDGAVHECNYCVDAQAVTRSTEILAALLTAVARDREGQHG